MAKANIPGLYSQEYKGMGMTQSDHSFRKITGKDFGILFGGSKTGYREINFVDNELIQKRNEGNINGFQWIL